MYIVGYIIILMGVIASMGGLVILFLLVLNGYKEWKEEKKGQPPDYRRIVTKIMTHNTTLPLLMGIDKDLDLLIEKKCHGIH